jgi:hypothetical protein
VTAPHKDADRYTVKDAIKAMRDEAKAYRKTAKESGQNRVIAPPPTARKPRGGGFSDHRRV